jgi:NAD(P)-dependent dehydrogenase (short-subunit alcohol dehydrogenase family)
MALQGKTALITGGTSGIGRAVAERLAGESAEVTITGRVETRGNEVVQAIEADRGKARFVASTLRSDHTIQATLTGPTDDEMKSR